MTQLQQFVETIWRETPELQNKRLVSIKEVCTDCQGSGTTWLGRPASDAVSFTQTEWEELDYDERDRWINGTYDSTCPECNGKNVIDVLDESQSHSDVVDAHERWMIDLYEYQAEAAAELAMGV